MMNGISKTIMNSILSSSNMSIVYQMNISICVWKDFKNTDEYNAYWDDPERTVVQLIYSAN